MEYPKVNIILLNYNGWEDTIECLESLQKISYPNYNLIVVDNNSNDNSIKMIKKWCDGDLKSESDFVSYDSSKKPVEVFEYDKKTAQKGGENKKEKKISNLPSDRKIILIQSGENIGFAGGNNIAITYSLNSDSDYIMLLNNDTVVERSFLEPLVEIIKSDNKIGIVGGKIFDYNDPNKILYAGGKVDIVRGSGYHFRDNKFKKSTEVSFVTGCLWLINPDLIEDIGLIDEKYFLYLEDTDYCFRTYKAEYKLIYNPNSVIYHKESKSTGKLSPLALYYSSRNRPYFVCKNSTSYLNKTLFWIFFLSSRLIKIFQIGCNTKYIFKGILDFFKKDMC